MNEEEYTLIINVSLDQLATIHEAQAKVVIGKASASDRLNVAWQAFYPMQKNSLTWVNNYGIYASTCSISNGSEIVQRSSTGHDAATNKIYTLQPDGGFSSPADGGDEDTFTILNLYRVKKVMTIGLYQNANVNGDDILGNAISAAPVMTGHTANITAETMVFIWLQANVKSNTVITKVTSQMTPLYFSSKEKIISVTYNAENGNFVKEKCFM